MSQNQGWGQQPPAGQPPNGPGWDQQPPAGQPPPWSPPPGQQPPRWSPPPPSGSWGWPSKYCGACGAVIDSRAEICPNCGVRQADVVYREPKSRPLAILLALLLGQFGVHRFYVGPISWGIAYLAFFWTGIPGVLGWLEAIYWLTRSDGEWAAKYGGPERESSGCAIGCLWVLALLPFIAVAVIVALVVLGNGIADVLSQIEQSLPSPAP